MATSVELYEELKGSVGEKGARMLAESIPRADGLAEKADLAALELKLEALRADIRGWMLAFFVPLWVGVYLTLAAIVLGFIAR